MNQFDRCGKEISEKINHASNNKYGVAKKYIISVLENDFTVKSYEVHYQFPSRIMVDIIERKPKYSVKSVDYDSVATVDEDGYVLFLASDSSLPAVETTAAIPNPGEKVTEKSLFSLNIVYNLSYLYNVTSASMKSDNLTVVLDNGKMVLFPLEGNTEYLLGSLNMILLRLNNLPEDTKIVNVNYIDLRYRNPILKEI